MTRAGECILPAKVAISTSWPLKALRTSVGRGRHPKRTSLGTTMVIALIHWKIKPDAVSKFLGYWQMTAAIQDHDTHHPSPNSLANRGLKPSAA